MKHSIVLLTGANGFIGTQIARYLLEDSTVTVLALVRAVDEQSARRKLERTWWDWPELVEALGSKIEPVLGEVSLPRLGLDQEAYGKIVGRVTHIIHTAADWRLVSLEEIRKTNVSGTANIIEFAKDVNKQGHLDRLSHISTAYVAGGRTGVVSEDDLSDEFGFLTNYEQSKYEGERLVQTAKNEIPVSIFRPSMVVGDSETGAIKTFNTIYFPLRLFLTGRMRFLPVKQALKINMVPVDYVAKSVVKLTFDSRAKGLTFHVVAPYESLPTVRKLLDIVRAWAQKELGIKLPKPIYLNLSPSSMKRLLRLQQTFSGSNRRNSNALISLAPYFGENRQLQRTKIDNILGKYDVNWKEILPNLLKFAVYNSFFHRSDRTVHEQVIFRLESKSRPIKYYDIIEGKIIQKPTSEMHHDILNAVASLRKLGVSPGDRVALTGLNSTRYFAIDIAIGLVGAVSVPLYYTAPPTDMNQILQASGSKLFFIGMPSLLSRIEELTSDISLVSICRNSPPQNAKRTITSWEEFLSKSQCKDEFVNAPVGFGDLATLRYSSGTTGLSKGMIFKHDNLRYMAESIVSVTPWRARNGAGSYLSFLPMGHVVEGLLAAYSPYYFPAEVDIYFLEDFKQLKNALAQVRPTIFFSVPRIYEKIWEALEQNPIGRFYVTRRKGLIKRVMRRIVRNMTLKKAGLNRCEQLITGSARVDEDLLTNFRELGVEIYDAYGMTEAPLITINRLGRNRLGTVGEPMPFTQIKIADDGEIMVKGPQVTAGYFDKTLQQPFKDSWLTTGDIGRLTDEGSLVIFGRKKELIKTSYGKCIYSGKIECMIREIPHVSESMLVGESKPYCGALLWVQKDHWNEKTLKTIDVEVEEMNKRLSNPEKIKKWAVLINDLSTENGDLTPNLKLKHNVVSERHKKVIEALYGGEAPQGDVHLSGVEISE